MKPSRVLVGISGASGAIYAQRLIQALCARPHLEVLLTATEAGRRLLREELGVDLAPHDPDIGRLLLASPSSGTSPHASASLPPGAPARLSWLPVTDIGAGPASGSYALDAVAIVPCSMRTLAAVAAGLADNLLTRAADVALKEGRRLVLAPREMPLSAIHLENMLRLARLGASIVPPMPGFYRHPQTIDDLVAFVVERLIGQMGLEEKG
jgi:flavin prenyltransferase